MGPMDPITITRTNLTQTLRKAGLALPSTVLDIPFIAEQLMESGSRGDSRNIGEIWREEEDIIENIENKEEIEVMKDFKVQKKEFVASNMEEIFTEAEFVEKRGLRGKYRWKNGLTVVEEVLEECPTDIENVQPNAGRGSDEDESEVLSSSWRRDSDRVGTLDREVEENQVDFDLGAEIGKRGENIEASWDKDIVNRGWLPPKIPSSLDFVCVCSHVDYNGILSVSTKDQVENRKFINLVLEKKYLGSKPSSRDKDWEAGEACIAIFPLDMKWYRATVISTDISRARVKVLFVDYGNESWCKEEDLRRNLYITVELPIQSFTVQMEEVISGNSVEWTIDKLDLLSYNLIDRELKVKLDKVYTSLPLVGRVEYTVDIGRMISDGKI